LLVKEPNRVANSSSQKRALETVVPGDGSPFKATAVSSVDGAKVSLRSSASQPVRQEIAKQDLNSAAKIRQNSETTKDIAKKSTSKENPVFVSLLWKVNYFGSGPRSLLITQT